MESNPSQTDGTGAPITDMKKQNQSKELRIIELEKAIKEKQRIIDERDKTVTEKEKAILELKTEKETKAREIEKVKSEAQEKIAELQTTNSKLLDPYMVVTVNAVREKSDDFDPQKDKTLLISWLAYNRNEWLADDVEIELNDLNKIYIQESLSIRSLPADQFPMFIEHLCPNSFNWLDLTDLTISFADFKKLLATCKITNLEISCITVTDEGGTVVSVDQLLKEVPSSFEYTFNDGEAMNGLAEKFAQLPELTKRYTVILRNIQEGFDLKTFGQFIQKNNYVALFFNVSKETFAEIERVEKEIVSNLPSTCILLIGNNTKTDDKESEDELAELKETNSKFIVPHDFFTLLQYKKSKFMYSQKKFHNKTLLTFCFGYIWNKWQTEDKIQVFLDDSYFKIFVQDSLYLYFLPAAKLTPLIERLQSNSFRELYLTGLTMSFVEYKNLVGKGNIRKLGIHEVTVTNEDGTAITVDQLLKEVLNIRFFNFTFNDGESVNGLAQKLVELPKFPKLETFQLVNIPKDFDSEVFRQFIKKNAIKDRRCSLRYTKEIIISSSSRPFFCDRMFNY